MQQKMHHSKGECKSTNIYNVAWGKTPSWKENEPPENQNSTSTHL